MRNLEQIYLQRKLKVVLDERHVDITQPSNDKLINGILANIADLGFTLSDNVINALRNLTQKEVTDFYFFLEENLPEMVGAHVKHVSLFKNFPDDIPEDTEFLINRIVNFLENVLGFTEENYKVLSCGHAIDTSKFDLSTFGGCPICLTPLDESELELGVERPPLDEVTPFKVIDLGGINDRNKILTNLVGANTSISQTDKEDIESFFVEYGYDVVKFLPKEIKMKENIALVSKLTMQYLDDTSFLSEYVKTATDVLRVITSLSGGDISLKDNCRFKSPKRSERRLFLSLLEKAPNLEEDMVRYSKRWIVLGKLFHVGEYQNKFPKTFRAIQKLRDNERIETFNSNVSELLKAKDWKGALLFLKERPGEFARKLDELLVMSNQNKLVINTFKSIADQLPTTMLLQLAEHFRRRTSQADIRAFFPKGNVAKMRVIEDNRPLLSNNVCNFIYNTCEIVLSNRFSKEDKLGKVYIDPNLQNHKVPFSQRSASKQLETITRGSYVALPDNKVIRAFCHWEEGNRRTDLDLSVIFYDKNWKQLNQVSYTNYSANGYAVHSGDFTSAPAPHGASEFVDIDIKKAKDSGVKYAVMNIYDYTNIGFVNHPVAFAGIMGRNDSRKGDKFEARTVKDKFDLTADTCVVIPYIIDVEDRIMYWADVALTQRNNFGGNNTESNGFNIMNMSKAIINIEKPSLYSLFYLHATARGEITDNIEEADFIFGENDGDITPKNIEEIMSNYLI